MKITCKAAFSLISIWFLLGTSLEAQTFDTLVFGDSASESSHSLKAYFPPATNISTTYWQNNTPPPSDPSATPPSDVVAGAMGLSARRLLPRTPNGDVYGGQMDFTMAVDPVKQNYFTAKLWGGSDSGAGSLILDVNGKEIGNRHGGGGLNEDPFLMVGSNWYANRFYYRTEPLPLSMTKGKTSVTITLRSLGGMNDYAPIFTYVPQYQQIMAAPSFSVYTAYTHAGTAPDVTGEVEGTAPTVPTPNTLSPSATATIAATESNVNSTLASDLAASGSTLTQANAYFLAECYDAQTNDGASWITYPSGMTGANVGSQIVAALDALVTSYASNSSVATNGWGGALGSGGMGDAIRLAWPLISGSMSTTVAYGGTLGTVTRQSAWSTALRASIDSGRYGRQTIANQAMTNAWNIYCANRGLLLVNSANALNESEAQRYMLEASGINAWLGNDLATGGTDGMGGGPVPTYGVPPYGPNWYMCTTKGTTKDGNGFVGSDYGEQGSFIYAMGLLSGNAQLLSRGITMTLARCEFRYPGTDTNGFLVMQGTDVIGDRNNNLPGHFVYLGRGYDNDCLMAAQGASAIGNACMGYFQEAINDGQEVANLDTSSPYLPSEWAAITAQPQTGIVLPAASGQPNYAWVDEENMAVSAKYGEERFYANLFWRQPNFINGLAKVFDLTPTMGRIADVIVDDVRFRPTGAFQTTANDVDSFQVPPDNPLEAYGGLNLPLAWRSDLTSIPANNRDSGRGTGYTLHYGNWLVGINASYNATYSVLLPSNFTSATDLVSGNVMSGPVVLQPKTSVVFYLTNAVDPSPPPARTTFLSAAGTNGQVVLDWYGAGAAAGYNVLRATTSGGPYTTLAGGVTGTSYVDTTVTNGTAYYYVIQSVNSNGVTSGNSMEASATPVASETSGLPSPWNDADIGNATGGTASILGGTFTLKGGPGDDSGSIDGCHYVYQPLVGDGVVTARVVSQTSTNTYAKSGLMIRDSLGGTGIQVSINIEPTGRSEFDYRSSDGANGSYQFFGSGFSAPYWVRLVRSGPTVTGYVSPDGATWTQAAQTTFSALPNVAYVGVATAPASENAGQTNTAVFDNVSMPAGATAAPATPAGFTASLGATNGGVTDPQAVTLNWTPVPGAASYTIARGTSASGPFTTVATGVGVNTYSDFGMANGTYYYVVSAVNSIGASANTTAVSIQLGAVPSGLTGLSATPSSGQVVLSWSASSGATSYTITRASSDGSYAVLVSGVTGTSYTDSSVTNGTLYYYGVEPVNALGQGLGGQTSALPPGSLPSPWISQDVGQPQPGAASYSGGVFTLDGSGIDIWNTSDQFHYVYQPVTGDCMITTEVASLQNTSVWDKVGLMIRNTLDANSAYYATYVTSGNGAAAQYRSAAGNSAGSGSTTSGVAAPYWVRIVRIGSTLNGYSSANGTTWASLGSVTIPMNTTVAVGLVDCSNAATAINTATTVNTTVLQSVANGGTASASTGTSGAEAAQAFDGSAATKWYNDVNGGTGWLEYQFAGGVSQVVTQYQITSATDVPQRDPAAWQLQGSSNGTTWTTIDSQTGQVFANRTQTNVYAISNTTAYPYYRLNITANAGGSGYGLQLAELSLFAPTSGSALLAPPAPTDISAAWSNGQIILNWFSSPGASSYTIGRSTTSGGPYTTVASGVTGTSYTDTTVTDGTGYYYIVTAVNSGGQSGNSPQDSATPLAPPSAATGLSATPGNAQATLNWSAATGAASYAIARSTVSGGPYTTVGTTTSTSYVDAGLYAGNYYYVVTSGNLAGQSAASNQASVTIVQLPGAVTGLAAQANSDQVALSWTATPGAATYTIGRSTTNGGSNTTIASGIGGTSYTDTGLTNGTTYYYVVAAVNTAGTGPNSNQVSGLPTAQNLYWDTTTAAGLGNGSGNWDINTTQTWSNTSAGTSNPLLTYLNDDNAYFQTAGTFTATIATGTTIKVGSINQSVNNTAATVNGGTLQINTNGGITNAVGSGNKGLVINSALTLNSPSVIIDNETTGGSINLNGAIAETGGSRAITKIGAGALQFNTAANTFSGGVTISSACTVSFYNIAGFGTGTITFNGGTSLTNTAQIYTSSSGVGSLANNLLVNAGSFGAYTGDHTMTLSGNLLNTGGTNGTFYLSTGTHAGSVTLSGNNQAFNGTLVYYDNGSTVLLLGATNSGSANAIWTLSGGSTKGIGANVSGTSSFQLGEVTSASGVGRLYNNQSTGTATFQIGDTTTNSPSFGGVLTDGTAGGKIGFTKTGTDTQILTGTNTYTGATTVNSGTLLVNGSTASGSAVTVNSGGTLGGSGTINGAATVTSGGILAPGNGSFATLTFAGGLSLNGGSILILDLGTSSDLIALSAGSYTAPSSGTVTIDLNAISGFGPGVYNLITGATGISASSFTLVTYPLGGGYVYQLSASSGTLSVAVTAAPPTGLVATPNNTEIDLTWTASTGATDYNVLRATTSGGSYTTIATGVTGTSYANTGLSDGSSYYYVVTAVSAGGSSGYSNQSAATVATPTINSWTDDDIGTVGKEGSAGYSSGVFTLQGSGAGITGTADGFDYTYQSLVGDGTIIAQVESLGAGETGVMIRQTLAANSQFVDILLQQSVGAVFQYRTTTGASAVTGATVGSTAAPYWLMLSRVGNVFTAYVAPDGVTWRQVGQVTNTMASSIYVGLAQSSLSNSSLSTGTLQNVSIVPTSAWSSQDIGTVPYVGASYYSNGVATIYGSGADIWNTADQFRFTYMPASGQSSSGDCDITARVTTVSNTNSWAKAGVMIRGSLAAGSTFAGVYVTPGSGIAFQWRNSSNGGCGSTSAPTSGLTAPYWVRVTRIGSTFTAYCSPDGNTWTTIGSQTITMSTTVYIGLPVTSHNSSATCTATLDNVTADPADP